jgi:glycosyltransferase involved in cell wall biosynthesis
VLAQTFVDFELLIIDDGSRDDTTEVVAARDDSRLRLVRTENGGVAAARNRGLDLATGSYVAFLDADDAWRPAKLERQHVAMKERPGVGVCFASAEIVDDDLRPIGAEAAVLRSNYVEALVLEGNVIAGGGSGVMARTAVIEQAGGFDTQLSQCADWDLWLRMSVITQFLPLNDSLVLYRSVAGTMSSDPELLERIRAACAGSRPYR